MSRSQQGESDGWGSKERWCCRESKTGPLDLAANNLLLFDSQQHHLSFKPLAISYIK